MATQVKTNIQNPKTFHYVRGYPFIGNLPEFTKDRLGLLQRMARTGDVCGLHFGPFPGILFNTPEHVQSILVEHAYDFDKGLAIHTIFRPVIGDGLATSEGAFHRHQRKLMAPPLSSLVILPAMPVSWDITANTFSRPGLITPLSISINR